MSVFKMKYLLIREFDQQAQAPHQVGGMLYQSGYIINNGSVKNEVLWQRIHVDHDFCKTYGN
jgi:hypothetical protein